MGIDNIPELVEIARENIERDQPQLLLSQRVILKTGNGKLGVPEFGPYDAIYVGAAAEHVPEALIKQLKVFW